MSSPLHRVAVLRSFCLALGGDFESVQARRRGILPRVSWNDLLALAAAEGLAPALWHSAREVADAMPSQVAEELHDHYRANVVRNARLRRQLAEAVYALNGAGVQPLVLKGAIQLIDGTADHRARWMSDIDLAVPPESWQASVDALTAIGFYEAPGAEFDHTRVLPLARVRTPGHVDLHPGLGSNPQVNRVLPLADALRSSRLIEFDGAHVRALAPGHQVLHNVLHSALQDLNHAVGGLPLRQLVDLARLMRAHRDALDWDAIRARMDSHRLLDVLDRQLWLAHRLLGAPMPRAAVGGARARLHETRVLVNYGLRWPAEAHRNIRFAFARDYLDWLYGHGDDPLKLTRARARHAALVLRREGSGAIGQVLRRHT